MLAGTTPARYHGTATQLIVLTVDCSKLILTNMHVVILPGPGEGYNRTCLPPTGLSTLKYNFITRVAKLMYSY